MQSKDKIGDRIQSKVQTLIQKLEVLTVENQLLKQEIERLRKEFVEQEGGSSHREHSFEEGDKISKVKDAIDDYIKEIESCIQLIQ